MADKPFCPIALTDWLEVVKRVGIPFIDGQVVAEPLRDDMVQFDVDGPHQKRLADAMEAALPWHGPRSMLRWDCCAGIDLKHGMGRDGKRPEHIPLILDDPRLLDIIVSEWPRETVPIIRRPWVELEYEDGWPREYRAFVTGNRMYGISSYYPQRPLSRRQREIDAVTDMTAALISALEPPFEYTGAMRAKAQMIAQRHTELTGLPSHGATLNMIDFTADFAVAADGEVLFLEGGPPHAAGADPCCFPEGRTYGVALERRAEDGPASTT